MSFRPIAVLLATVLLAATGCASIASDEIEQARRDAHAQPVVLHAEDRPDASIATDGAVRLGDRPLALTPAQQALTLEYRQATLDVVDLSLEQAEDVTRGAVARSLFGWMTGRLDKTVAKLERESLAIVHSPEFCNRMETLRQRQQGMVAAIPELLPYARITPATIADCRAGRDFTVGL